MSKFAELKLDWLKRHTKIETRPCPEIFRALLVGINPSELIKGFKAFVSEHESNWEVVKTPFLWMTKP